MDHLDLRLADMDAMGIDVQAVAVAVYQYYYWADAELAARTSRTINTELVEATSAHGDRFVPLATVPLQDPEAAVAALEALVRTYAAEVENTPVRANLVNPGPVATAMRAKAMPGEDPATIPQPDDLTETFVKLALPTCTDNGKVVDFQ